MIKELMEEADLAFKTMSDEAIKAKKEGQKIKQFGNGTNGRAPNCSK